MVKLKSKRVRRLKKKRMFRRRRFEPENRQMQQNLSINKRLRLPLPSRYRTTLEGTVIGNLAISAVNGFMIYGIKANDLHIPFSLALSGGSITLAAAASGLTLATLAPAGYGDFMRTNQGGLYDLSRVLASRIHVTVVPTVATDTISMCIVPVLAQLAAKPNNIIAGGSMPYSKGPIICTGNNNIKQNRLSNYISTAQIYGLSPRAILDENDYSALANVDSPENYQWYVMFQTNSAAATTNPVYIEIKMKWYVQFEATTGSGLRDIEV